MAYRDVTFCLMVSKIRSMIKGKKKKRHVSATNNWYIYASITPFMPAGCRQHRWLPHVPGQQGEEEHQETGQESLPQGRILKIDINKSSD